MKISYNWLKQFLNTNASADELSKILTAVGLEVESLEKVQAVPGGLEGLVVGYVKDCIQHPNADRLRVTKVDIGSGQELQVVCGAPNVAAGQKVIVATVGTTVFPLEGEPFKISKSKIRGEVSEGMICAEDEIGLGKSHEGILVLPENTEAGTLAKGYFNLNDDFVFEIGLTPNRADAASHLGVARDIAAYLQLQIQKPDISAFRVENTTSAIEISVEDGAALRYAGLTISGITVKPSPDWLREKLAVIGVRSVNNVVDATNYVLHDLGQPLHVFDAEAIKGDKVVVKKCAEGTPFVTLDGQEIKLSSEDLMICNAEEPMCVAGVFGGENSGVKESTTAVFLESACFNPVSVRKTAKRHGLKTDSSFRFERGTDPEIPVFALKRAALLIQELAGGEIVSDIFDHYSEPVKPFQVSLTFTHVNDLIGQEIPQEDVRKIVTGLGIKIVSDKNGELQLEVPPFKVDVTRPVDVIEEILRIYGYDNIQIPAKVNASLNYASKPDKDIVQHQIADLLTANGFFEIMGNSLTKSAYSDDPEHAVRILNPLSSDLDVMRQSLIFSGLEAIAYNSNRKHADLKLYEFGRIYQETEGKYQEQAQLSVFITGNSASENWNTRASSSDFYQLKSVVDLLVKKLKISNVQTDEIQDAAFSYGLSYKRGQKWLVKFGALTKATAQKVAVNKEVFAAVFDWDFVFTLIRNNQITYTEISKFPAVRRDLSMLLDQAVQFEQLKRSAFKVEKKLLKEVDVFDVYQGDKLPEGKKSYALSFVLQNDEATLTDKQIDAIMQKLMLNFEKEFKAEIRK